ncbi:hypothetical protein TRFO_14429 [Tritrichomonas foetus]|uniref:Sel1 repeat family protein n=1 Tax=Tritrichomonas foetus TaxID=1144522 RepID=A0A1J4KZF0_9EUKA|nr:hypothetical protein TRFO_14429 [Tritrichomonas foetus]|eukprot:OHT15086.1 hypothetical protein TRFO_14429 [Tritrichomonas foetus]
MNSRLLPFLSNNSSKNTTRGNQINRMKSPPQGNRAIANNPNRPSCLANHSRVNPRRNDSLKKSQSDQTPQFNQINKAHTRNNITENSPIKANSSKSAITKGNIPNSNIQRSNIRNNPNIKNNTNIKNNATIKRPQKKQNEWNETTIAVKKQADGGCLEAMFVFAKILFNGRGVVTDRTGARKYFQMAADGGHCGAQLQYADILLNGWGMPKDPASAVKYLNKAADSGSSDALCMLGRCYNQGQGVKQNKEEAEKAWRRGSDLGHGGCQFELAQMLEFKGPEFKDEALSFYQKASNQGFPSASMNFLRLLNKK